MSPTNKLIELAQMLEIARRHNCEKVVAEIIKVIREETDKLILSMNGDSLKERTKEILRNEGRVKAIIFYRTHSGLPLKEAVHFVQGLE
jgi:hypothetical protein